MNPFAHFFRQVSYKFNAFYSLLLMICLFGLTSCNVDDSFGYAFAGTGGVMVVGLIIATFVTRRSDKRKREGER